MKQAEFRKATGMTQKAFAARIGVHPVTACRYERGVFVPGAAVMQRILAEFGGAIRPDDYFDHSAIKSNHSGDQ
jgi:transcriptional regulator with XRE-family HTH domain